MESKKILLIDYVSKKFSGINRKFTNNPYFDHLLAVAEKAHSADIKFGFEIGLLHDLYEDTYTYPHECIEALWEMGYNKKDAWFISTSVIELTNPYTKENSPELSNSERNKLVLEHLETISPNSQSIKYCDIIDNCKNVTQANYNFAKKYLPKKSQQLEVMNNGNEYLKTIAQQTIYNSMVLLESTFNKKTL